MTTIQRKWNMDFITNTLAAKPLVGVGTSIGTGILGTILTWIGVLTPLLGFVSVIFGLMAGYYTWRIQRRKWKNGEGKAGN
jgi:hypothetical protein